MKIFKTLFVAIVALGMVACNNEEVVDLSNLPESTISVRVVPATDGPTVRSTGDLAGSGILAAESAIKQLEVFVFAGETPAGYGSATPVSPATTVTEVLNIATTAGSRSIFVVANANIGAVANKTTLLAKTRNLPANIANGLPMTSNNTPVTLEAGKNQYGFTVSDVGYDSTAKQQISAGAPLKVYRVNARVAIVGATLALETADAALFDNLKDVQVAMFNVPKTSKLFGPALSLAMNANYLYGAAWDSPLGTYQKVAPAAEDASFLDAPVAFPITTETEAPYYYVNENTAADAGEQMFIVLRGKTYKGETAVVADGYFTDAAGYTYYPVWVNATKTGYTYNTGTDTGDSKIRRNTQYNITLTIKHKGNPNIDPPVSAKLDVNVSVEPWLVVDQGVIW